MEHEDPRSTNPHEPDKVGLVAPLLWVLLAALLAIVSYT